MRSELNQLVKKVRKRDSRAISRLITLSENDPALQKLVVKTLYGFTGKAHIIGITGAPGAGKSTLVDGLTISLRNSGKKTAVLAVDPSSPFTGGAILGDRIRMANTAAYHDIFVRSMASRGALGGLSHATLSAVYILDAAGFDYILVETVGVGQAEVDIARVADTSIVVLVPGMGDEVQSVKAGILEIADIFVVNKADRDGTHLLERDLLNLINLIEYNEKEWKPAVTRVVATEGKGIKELKEKLLAHRTWYDNSPDGDNRRLKIMQHTLIQLASDQLRLEIIRKKTEKLQTLARSCLQRKIDPYTAAGRLAS